MWLRLLATSVCLEDQIFYTAHPKRTHGTVEYNVACAQRVSTTCSLDMQWLTAGCLTWQVAGQDRIAIIVPAEALPQFYQAVGLCLEERQAGLPSSS